MTDNILGIGWQKLGVFVERNEFKHSDNYVRESKARYSLFTKLSQRHGAWDIIGLMLGEKKGKGNQSRGILAVQKYRRSSTPGAVFCSDILINKFLGECF